MLRAILTAVLVAVLTLPALGGEPGKKETGLRADAAKAVLTYVDWCAQNGAPDAGKTALAAAKSLGAPEDALTAADEALDDAEQTADDAAIKKARGIHAPKIAKILDKLAGTKHAAEDDERFVAYRLDAIRWDASKSRMKKAVGWVKGQDDDDHGSLLMARARGVAGEAGSVFDSLELDRAKKGLLLLGSPDHDLVGFVSLPKSWKKGKTYPVLVGVDGAGSNHKGYGVKSASARGSRDVIVLSPVTLSNTNALAKKTYPHYPQSVLDEWDKKRLDFDGPGVDALLRVISARFGGEDKVFLTGFSGGGQYTYYKLLKDPEHVAGAAPACANFAGNGKQGAPGAGDDGGPPVLLLTGENDKHREFTHGDKNSPGIEPQTDHAEKTLKGLGYTNFERRMVKAGHSPLHNLVYEFIDEVLAGKR